MATRGRRGAEVSIVLVMGLVLGLLTVLQQARSGPGPLTVDTGAAISQTPVSADSLPTVQINGVVWNQATRGNIVYAVGSFTQARPAGSAPGVNVTSRRNMVAYDIRTGVMTSFNANLNGTGRSIAIAPNGTIYVGGDFTSAQGTARGHIAAFRPDGTLISTFKPDIDGAVRALSATDTTVYAGGSFTTATGVARNRLAAFNATNGALLGWTPKANDQVTAMTLSPDSKRLIIGGRFTTINSAYAYGLGSVDAANGTLQPFAANKVIKDGGARGAITHLSTDGTSIYGTGYSFGPSTANFEGSFSANPTTGNINWMEDCHGDAYAAFAQAGAVYVVSHHHDCARINGFPHSEVPMRGLAYSNEATQKIAKNTVVNYTSFEGQPAPTLLNWFPVIDAGTYTGQNQGAWSIVGNSEYLAVGGEFPTVNGKGQQGLVRFAVRTNAQNPNAFGPMLKGATTKPALTSPAAGSVKLTIPNNWDRDDASLTYRVVRDGNTAAPVGTGTATGRYWKLPALTYTDTGVPAGAHTYRIDWVDSKGNTTASDNASITVAGGGTANTPPTAAFTSTVNALTVSVNGSSSTDPDGTIASYAWTFGDTGTATGATASRTYGSAGTYPVTLTVTDNKGATATVTRNVTVTAGGGGGNPQTIAADSFTRSASGGFGSADTGGAWTPTNAASALSVAGGAGKITFAAGAGAGAKLASVAGGDVDAVIDFALDKAPAGASGYFYLDTRTTGVASGYRAKVTFSTGGAVNLKLVRVIDGTETSLGSANISGLTYTAGTALRLRLTAAGSGTTALQAKLWVRSAAEPSSWTVTASDTTAALQSPGGVAVSGYLSGSVTNAPVAINVDNLAVTGS